MNYTASDELTIRAKQLGEVGEDWLKDLPAKVERLQNRFNLSLGDSLGGGTESLVIAAQSDWGDCVLKLGLPDNLKREARAYELANGQGYAYAHAYIDEEDALITEALGGMLVDAGLPVAEQIEHLVCALESSWQVDVGPEGLMSGSEKAQWHLDYVKPQLEQNSSDLSQDHLERTTTFANERQASHQDATSTLSHGDGHAWNALAASGDLAYKFVDPDGHYAERAYDLSILMREWVEEMLIGDPSENGVARCQALSERTGEPMRAIWQWGFVEQVSTYLMLLELNWPEVAKQHLAVVEGWSRVTDFD